MHGICDDNVVIYHLTHVPDVLDIECSSEKWSTVHSIVKVDCGSAVEILDYPLPAALAQDTIGEVRGFPDFSLPHSLLISTRLDGLYPTACIGGSSQLSFLKHSPRSQGHHQGALVLAFVTGSIVIVILGKTKVNIDLTLENESSVPLTARPYSFTPIIPSLAASAEDTSYWMSVHTYAPAHICHKHHSTSSNGVEPVLEFSKLLKLRSKLGSVDLILLSVSA